ncbi:hypothetical protein NEMIN01_0823 [Nematocida minor]|uniref:uncharacterized protein n=1 Tax=Nematocida minor TaxID=1912983 RepID=UPI00221F6FE1|nr:uncharacterized protein NEMIN01_0823 [Nematocida minor]KAI5190038.1 hypothetical protein NEMIN01_0823 [Nematocida minor]
MNEVLFSGALNIFKDGSTAEYTCELSKKPNAFELKLYNQASFTILLSRINETEYYSIKETQSIRVDFFRFMTTLAELLKRVQRKELFIEVGSTLKIVERNAFRNILHLELPLKDLSEAEYKMYISDILSRLNRHTAALERENSILKEELSSARHTAEELRKKHEEEMDDFESHKKQKLRQEDELSARISELTSLNEKHTMDVERLKKQNRIIEEDLRKANDIIKRNFEDLKNKIKTENILKQETNNYKHDKEELETINNRLEMDLMEKNEEIKILKELETERIEAINNLKVLNKSLNRKLESTYRIYNRIYKPQEENEEDSRTEETTSSLIAPESIHY